MSNNFYPWMSDSTANCQSSSDFSNDTQRKNGFQGGAAASSLRVNTALRQSSLVVCALMNVVKPDDNTFDVQSLNALSKVQDWISDYFNTYVKTTALNTTLANYVLKTQLATSSNAGLIKVGGTFSGANQYALSISNGFGYVTVTKKVYRHEITMSYNKSYDSSTTGCDFSDIKLTLLTTTSSQISSLVALDAILNNNSVNTNLLEKYIQPVFGNVRQYINNNLEIIPSLLYAITQDTSSTSHRIEVIGFHRQLSGIVDHWTFRLAEGTLNITGDIVTEITL